ncbi:MAG: glycosyltransferase family 2 protein [Campylobacterota bacterium]|nr:glycosyltransferase family 2 protein [Campylobacterota bacterium]
MVNKFNLKHKYIKRLVRKNYFVEALAKDNKSKILTPDTKAWCYFNLGMYKTAASFEDITLEARGLFAKIVSLGACGEFEKLKRTLVKFQKLKEYDSYISKLANHIVRYMPNLVYSLIKDNPNLELSLYCAILLKLEYKDKAYNLLDEAIKSQEDTKNPELLLYFNNASKEAFPPQKQLKLVNQYLKFYNIPKVTLKDNIKALNTLNIKCKIDKKISGPLVTIIMTTYNTKDIVSMSIESILEQTYKNIELLIVDDASTDDTISILKAWEKRDQRIRIIALQQNGGTYIAKNTALLQAKGRYVTCHDSDDWSHPLKIERQVKPLINNWHLVATISSWVRVDQNGQFYARPVHTLMRQNPSSLMFKRKKILETIGVWDSVRTGADSEYIERIKLVFGRKRVRRIKEPLSFGAHRENSLMTSSETGYCDIGMSPQRLKYWESWRQWHREELENGRKPYK